MSYRSRYMDSKNLQSDFWCSFVCHDESQSSVSSLRSFHPFVVAFSQAVAKAE